MNKRASKVSNQSIFSFLTQAGEARKVLRPRIRGNVFQMLVWNVNITPPEDDMAGERLDDNNIWT